MKEEEGPTIDLLCIVKIIPAIISISPIIIRYFPIFFGRCTVFISLHKIRVFVILRYGVVYKKFCPKSNFNLFWRIAYKISLYSISIFYCIINSNRIIIPRFRIRNSNYTIYYTVTKINFSSFIFNNIIN